MQLNIYVPKERAGVLEALDLVARRTGRRKNEVALEALETYLGKAKTELGVYHLGEVRMPSRDELYLENWEP
jgi:hypothetical protein